MRKGCGSHYMSKASAWTSKKQHAAFKCIIHVIRFSTIVCKRRTRSKHVTANHICKPHHIHISLHVWTPPLLPTLTWFRLAEVPTLLLAHPYGRPQLVQLPDFSCPMEVLEPYKPAGSNDDMNEKMFPDFRHQVNRQTTSVATIFYSSLTSEHHQQ